MKRRSFLEAASVTALSPLVRGLDHLPVVSDDHFESIKNTMRQKKEIAGYAPEELLKQYTTYLFDDFLPFMDRHVIDHESGGFLCNTDRTGKNISSNKRSWFDGRGIWVYSFLYNNLKKDPAYLDTAKKTVDFVLKINLDKNKLWPASYTREGKELTDFPVDIYGDLFIAEGLAEFSRASQDPQYWFMAKEILLKCLRLYDSDDFHYIVDYGPKAPVISAPRVGGCWMVFLRTSYCLLSQRPDPEIEKIADRCINSLIKFHYNPEFDLFNEVLNHDLSRPEGPFSQFVYTGHVIETMWMIMYEAVRIKDQKLFLSASEKFKRHLEVAWDDVYGGVFRCLDDVNSNTWKVDKVLWAQEEALISTLYMIEHTGDVWAYDWFSKMYSYVLKYYPLRKYGYSLWNVGGDRKMTFINEAVRVENYHHPRHLMLNILTLERIINKKI